MSPARRNSRSSRAGTKRARSGGNGPPGGKRGDDKRREGEPIPQPVDVVDGIPDRSARTPAWKYVLLVAIFAAWVAFLIYVAAAGRLGETAGG